MKEAADNLDFETAVIFRDKLKELKSMSVQKSNKKISIQSKRKIKK